ncbi:MAG TPA: hypothetical protein VNL14_07900 [Candidatus Acidoferrales bacterium]|nr:hypothetical protein [Candidatus Acidoferrales bacterium]
MTLRAPIVLACRNYDGTNALLRGLIHVPGLKLAVREIDNVAWMFAGMFRGEFDVSEMSLAELVYYVSRDRADFTAIPVFPARVFRHRFIYCHADAGIGAPEDLNRKRLGFVRWVQSAAIWIRGMLTEEYGVSPEETSWFTASVHHWDDPEHEDDVRPRNGARIQRLERGGASAAARVRAALLAHAVDAVGVTEPLASGGAVRPLFPNYADVEADYFRRTKIFPIMHVLAISNRAVALDPELPPKLFELFSRAKKWARQWRSQTPSLVLAWNERHLAEERAVFGGDPWAYGLEPNRHGIEKFLAYCYEQGVSGRNIAPEELFARSSWGLCE